MQARGQAIGVERIPGSDVPEEYPAEIGTEDALALEVELVNADHKSVTLYFEWPDEGADERLAKLLALRDVPIDRFGDLHGETLLVTVENGHYVPVLPEEEPRGDERGIYGVLAGMGFNLAVALATFLGFGGLAASGAFVLLWLAVTFVLLPVSTYLDSWHLRTTTNWEGGPLFWTTLSMIPGVNVMTVAAYLLLRGNAEPII